MFLLGSCFHTPENPCDFLSLRGSQSADSSLARLPLLPAAARRPSSTPGSPPAYLHSTHPLLVVSSIAPRNSPVFIFLSPVPGLLVIFPPIKTPSGIITRLLSPAACLGLPIGPHPGSNRNRTSLPIYGPRQTQARCGNGDAQFGHPGFGIGSAQSFYAAIQTQH